MAKKVSLRSQLTPCVKENSNIQKSLLLDISDSLHKYICYIIKMQDSLDDNQEENATAAITTTTFQRFQLQYFQSLSKLSQSSEMIGITTVIWGA